MHSKQLLQILKPLSVAVEQNANLPVLEYVQIKDGRATTSNLQLSINNKCDLPDIMLPYRKFVDTLSLLDGELEFTVGEAEIKLTCDKKIFKFGTIAANLFPAFSIMDENEMQVNEDLFFAIQQAAKNESLQELSQWRGIYIGSKFIIGNDNYGMFKYDLASKLPNMHVSSSFAKATQGWQSGWLQTNGNHLQCKNDDLIIDMVLMDTNFPDFDSVFPASFTSNVFINRKEFEIALKQSQVFEAGIITAKFEPGSIAIYYENKLNEGSVIPVAAKHDLSMEINFDSKILSRLISCLPYDCETINMQIESATKGVYIIHNNITLLIIPYRK